MVTRGAGFWHITKSTLSITFSAWQELQATANQYPELKQHGSSVRRGPWQAEAYSWRWGVVIPGSFVQLPGEKFSLSKRNQKTCHFHRSGQHQPLHSIRPKRPQLAPLAFQANQNGKGWGLLQVYDSRCWHRRIRGLRAVTLRQSRYNILFWCDPGFEWSLPNSILSACYMAFCFDTYWDILRLSEVCGWGFFVGLIVDFQRSCPISYHWGLRFVTSSPGVYVYSTIQKRETLCSRCRRGNMEVCRWHAAAELQTGNKGFT